jgi:hypothetical protein
MFFSTYPTHDFTLILPALMDGVVAPRMASLRDESLQHSSGAFCGHVISRTLLSSFFLC